MATTFNVKSPSFSPPSTGVNGPQATTTTAPAGSVTMQTQGMTPTGEIASAAASFRTAVTLDGGYSADMTNDTFAVVGQNAVGVANSVGQVAGTRSVDGSYQRGSFEVGARAVDDKCFAINVHTMHSNPKHRHLRGGDDNMCLVLETKLQGEDEYANPQEGILRVASLANGPLNNKGPFDGEHEFVVSYADLDKFFRSLNPQLGLFDKAGNFTGNGATLAVRGEWAQGHYWGGYGRLGVIEIPAPLKKTSSVLMQAANMQGAQAASASHVAANDLPIDLEFKLPDAVRNKFGIIFDTSKPMTVSTRLERELKGKVKNEQEQEAAIVRMGLIAAGFPSLVNNVRTALTAELVKTAGMSPSEAKEYAADFHVKPHTAWAQKDEAGQFTESPRLSEYRHSPEKLVQAGIARNAAEAAEMIAFMDANQVVFHDPLPLEDKYQGKKSEMERSIIRRIRSNEIFGGLYNVKPGPGVLQSEVDPATAEQPCGLIRARIEASMPLKSKDVDRSAVENYEKTDGSSYNVIGQLLEETGIYVPGFHNRYDLSPDVDQTVIKFTMMQERHRFDVECRGLMMDTSIDFVSVEDPPNSGKVIKRQVVEMELEHKFLKPQKKPESTTAAAEAAPATELRNKWRNHSEQQAWAGKLKNPSLNVPPRFHRVSDLDDKELWQTRDQRFSNAVTNALVGLLYPAGVSSCEQKGVEMARAIGKLPPKV